MGQTLGDRVWLDTNANGVQDSGEQGVANVTVQLKDTAGTVLQTTTTDINGNYLFDVAVGSYQVTVLTPSGYLVTSRDAGANDGLDSDIDAATGTTGTVDIAAGQQNLTVDAGLVLGKPGIDIEKTTSGPSNSNTTAANYATDSPAICNQSQYIY